MSILTSRPRQPAWIRWGGAIVLFILALLARLGLGRFHGTNPGLIFYPAVLLASVFFGWKEALLVLFLAVTTAAYWFLPTDMYMLPVGWTLVGCLNIAIIAALHASAERLVAANERQRILFQELQHRVANTLQAVVSTLEVARIRAVSSPTEAARLMGDAARRYAASADVHRRLSDPDLFHRKLGSILRDAVVTVIDPNATRLLFDIDELDLMFDQMSIITMLIIEMANNAQKHVFQKSHGSSFSVFLKAAQNHRAMLRVRDDGPGMAHTLEAELSRRNLGLRIVQGLVAELAGTITVTTVSGTEIVVEFPIMVRPSAQPKPLAHQGSARNATAEP